MATLTQTAEVTRKAIKIGAILVVLIIVARVVLVAGVNIWTKLFPKPPAAPTMAFGQLPSPNGENNIATPAGEITYSLETADGALPVLPYTFKVYFMPHPTSAFGSFDQMKTVAGNLGFSTTPSRTSQTTWRFADRSNPLLTLDIDEISLNFRVKYNYISDQSLFRERNFSSKEQITSEAVSYFSRLGTLPEEFRGGAAIVTYYKFDTGILSPTTSLAEADAVGVTLLRTNINDLPVVSPDYRQGLVSILFSGSNDSKKRVLESRFLVSPVDLENWATYSPISTTDAWAKLQAKKAIFASLPSPMSSTIVIRKVYTAYLDPYPAQSFLQPVLVFSDEKGFVAYVPLIQ